MPAPDAAARFTPPSTLASAGGAGLRADGAALAGGPALQALADVLQTLVQAEQDTGPGRQAGLCQAHTGVARTLSGLLAYSPAESHLAQALHWAEVMGSTDIRTDLLCALAEVVCNAAELARSQGAAAAAQRSLRSRARAHAAEAARLAGQTTDPHWEVKVLLRASDVLDRCGRHDDAVQLQHRALVLIGLHNPEVDEDALPQDTHAGDAFLITAPGQLM